MKVFISHSSHDKWIARKISEDLTASGINTFLDAKNVNTGSTIEDEIYEHLETSDELLLLLSPSALDSHWVMLELGGAKALRKRVVPILLHVHVNDLPQPITKLLARDINEIEKYYDEVRERARTTDLSHDDDEIANAEKMRPPSDAEPIGTKILIKDSATLNQGTKTGPPSWTAEMDHYSGAEALITGYRDGHYTLDVDGGRFVWAGRWLKKNIKEKAKG